MTEALVVDDNRQTADALHQMLDVLGVKARVAYGSSAAISILGSGFTPNLICLDVNMPGIDGVEILLYLRREPRLISVPVIVITSDDQPETRRKVMSAGATELLIKPATIDALESALKKAKML
ncbi:MAG: Transcriptional regulatory protein tctD [Anaerolineales bacterium]|nr:response regulator [Anaerolineae bacterium]MBL8105147.1 response regulator [Anaerolineales bacterium]MBV6400672.1 Transcriptional regulatory protein tctD [Anaerolineales bacterium]MCC7188303.1 response regulator [Anaerolineales bacterium]HQU35369.1 response regulator [Anaerolineales bacterium]